MQKEQKEWIHSWCDDTNNHDLPRILLVGDSITYGYQERVRELLAGVCYVDYLSTSYAVDSPMYRKLVELFVADSAYDLLHFNHGLHGWQMSKRTYKSYLKKLLAKITQGKRVILANSTVVYRENSKRKHTEYMKQVKVRNQAMQELAEEFGFSFNDLYACSVEIPFDKRRNDGFHYTAEGSEILAQTVALKIKKELSIWQNQD